MLPDVTAVDKAFDYLVPADLARLVRAGAVVRVMLAGRKVRCWVLDPDVGSDVDPAKLRPILAVVSFTNCSTFSGAISLVPNVST